MKNKEPTAASVKFKTSPLFNHKKASKEKPDEKIFLRPPNFLGSWAFAVIFFVGTFCAI
jgi:hypothetical protein